MSRLAIAVCCYAAIFAISFFFALVLRFDLNAAEFLLCIFRNGAAMPEGLTGLAAFEFKQFLYAKDVFRDSVLVLVLLKVGVVLFSREWRRRLRYSTIHDIGWSAGICLACGVLTAALQLAHLGLRPLFLVGAGDASHRRRDGGAGGGGEQPQAG